MSKYRNIVFDDFKSRFLANFFSNYRHRLVLEIPFLNHIFLKTSKYRTENLHFPSTAKYYVLSLSCIELISGRLDKYKLIHLNFLRALTLRARTFFKNFEKMQAISLHWFAAQQQNSTLRRQKIDLLSAKFRADFYKLSLFL